MASGRRLLAAAALLEGLMAVVGCEPTEQASAKSPLDEQHLTRLRCRNDPEARLMFPDLCKAFAKQGKQREKQQQDPVRTTEPSQQAVQEKKNPELHPVACPSAKVRLNREITAWAPPNSGEIEFKEIGDLNDDGLPEIMGVYSGMISATWIVSRTEKTCYVEIARELPGDVEPGEGITNGWRNLRISLSLNRGPSRCEAEFTAESDGKEYALDPPTHSKPAVQDGDITETQCVEQARQIAASSVEQRKEARQPPDVPSGSSAVAASRPSTSTKSWHEQVDEVMDKARACSSTPLECENACHLDENSVGCIAYGVILATGAGVSRDYPRGSTILVHACNAGRKTACAALKSVAKKVRAQQAEEQAKQADDDVKEAKKKIPRLLAKCDRLKAKIESLKVRVRAAIRRRDSDELQRLQEPLQTASDHLREVMQDLNDAANTATGDDTRAWERLAKEARRRCVP